MEGNRTKQFSILDRLAKWSRVGNALLVDNLKLKPSRDLGNVQHMHYAASWIASAQTSTPDGGVSLAYSLKNGWRPSYPETTGYIIPTLLNYSHLTGEGFWQNQAISMADWLLTVQLSDGAFGHPSDLSQPVVFDTGQILFGFLGAFHETNAQKYLDAAAKAAYWLVCGQEPSGSWQKHCYEHQGRAYHARVAWALVEAYKVLNDDDLLLAARKNLDWVVTQQLSNGWFKGNTFPDESFPTLHTIAYATRGLLEAGIILKHSDYIEAATLAARALLQAQRDDGSLPGAYNQEWQPTVRWSCLTGNAQIAIVWLKEYMRTSDRKFLESARGANAFLKKTQNTQTKATGILGGIKGSHPIQGQYMPFNYPNWATKFYLDALMWEEAVSAGSRDDEYQPMLPG